MEVSILLISSIALFVGYIIGKNEGLSSGYRQGIYEGAEESLKLVEKYSNGGLKYTLDWETIQRLLKEQMSKN
tara:strand:- start:3282 stop:3500 length:219 start_codon:yes stop_codon:yes gene_type:complete